MEEVVRELRARAILKCQKKQTDFFRFWVGLSEVVSGLSVSVLFLRPTALAPSRGMLVVR